MKNRVLFSTLITRRRGKIACAPGHRAGRFGAAGVDKSDKPAVGGDDAAKTG